MKKDFSTLLDKGNTALSSGTMYQPQPNQPLINVRLKQAAKEMGYSISWLYVLVDKGVVPRPHSIYAGSRAKALFRHELDAVIAGTYINTEVK